MFTKHRFCGRAILLVLAVLCLALPAGAASYGTPETDGELFAACCEAVGYTMPGGYALEGFFRADLNGDGITDLAGTLTQPDGTGRLLVVMMSGSSGYAVTESAYALPAVDDDSFLGMDAGEDHLSLFTGDGATQREYRFTREDDGFRLSTVTALAWAGEGGAATQELFDYDAGEYTKSTGKMGADAFISERQDDKRSFDGHAYGPALAEFDQKTFPTTWETLEPLVSGTARPAAQRVQCVKCGAWFDTDAVLLAHACPGAPVEPMIFCNACGKWYAEGDAFRSHVCTSPEKPAQVQCNACGNWFDPDVIASHACPNSTKAPQVHCDVCGGWFDEGSAFRNHVCVSYPTENRVYCDVCGNWFEEGEAFRNHVCAPAPSENPEQEPTPGEAPTHAPAQPTPALPTPTVHPSPGLPTAGPPTPIQP